MQEREGERGREGLRTSKTMCKPGCLVGTEAAFATLESNA